MPTSPEPLRLAPEVLKTYYDFTYKAKEKPESDLKFKFIESVQIPPPTKSVSSETQALSATVLFATSRTSALSNYLRETWRLKKESQYAAITQAQLEASMESVSRRLLEQPGDESNLCPGDHKDRNETSAKSGPDSGPESQWYAVKKLIPNIECLAREAGYENFKNEYTVGMSYSLYLNSLCRKQTPQDAIAAILRKRLLFADIHIKEELDRNGSKSLLDRDIPLVIYDTNGDVFVCIGYCDHSDKTQLFFCFAPNEVERSVHYDGRTRWESKLEEEKKLHPPASPWSFARYNDLESSHKQIQHSSFCAIRFSPRLRFSFIDNVRVDEEMASKIVRESFEDAAKSAGGK